MSSLFFGQSQIIKLCDTRRAIKSSGRGRQVLDCCFQKLPLLLQHALVYLANRDTRIMAQARTADPKPQAPSDANSKNVVDGGGQNENVYLFVPNLIGKDKSNPSQQKLLLTHASLSAGYLRIVLAFGSLYEMPSHPRTCSLLYSISCLLDAFDGYAARRYNQATRFGVVLDMVTDRCTSASLLAFLASVFPRWTIVFQGLIVLDMASHYAHMYATLALGDNDHKRVAQSSSWIMRIYYNNKVSKPKT
jgi:CDP-diacylglycerol--inositol 3-phosphatidyltransferase